ncbi:hypothetical protein NPIL_472921 [Nephila pilipes]|uniref:Uncharacterized protein n=1 Tax=Nephila pilipes TaxID=299642 RepID=A0A8X6QTT7_NEPPI|nr:hypothetical protein NPIL_472921 [Nephila pilipes]
MKEQGKLGRSWCWRTEDLDMEGGAGAATAAAAAAATLEQSGSETMEEVLDGKEQARLCSAETGGAVNMEGC